LARTTLRKRLTLLFGVTLVAVLSLAGWYLSHQSRIILIGQARQTAVALARSLAAASSNDFFSYNYVALEQKAEEAALEPEVAYIVLYDKEGEVAAYTGLGDLEASQPPTGLAEEGMPGDQPLVVMGLMTGYEMPGMDVLVSVEGPAGGTWGVVRLGMELGGLYARIRRMTMMILLLGAGSMVAAWAIAAWFTRRITVPVSHLVEASMKVSEGDLTARVIAPTGDELEDLAEKFNWMVERIADQRNTLEANLREIRALKDYSDLVIWSVTNGLVTVAADGAITTFNRQAEEIFGIPAEEAAGRTPARVWGEGSAVARMLEDREPAGTPAGLEVLWDAPDGQRIIEVSVAPVGTAEEPMGLLALFTDLTEKKALEGRIRRADRLAALGTLAAGLAHEIRNPLTAVRAFVQMFPLKADQEKFQEKFSRIVPRELDRVNELIDNLLDLVRKPRLTIKPLDVDVLVDQVLETLEPEMASRQVALERLEGTAHMRVRADESYLSRGLHNIVLNAIQAMPDGGTLKVDIREQDEGQPAGVVISVTDTGTGIPEEQVGEIFNPFFTSKEKGTGLGLAVTNKVIEDQGGSIDVVTERGLGTTFSVTMPGAGQDEAASAHVDVQGP
jgi:PAS domain S-box-containing protein